MSKGDGAAPLSLGSETEPCTQCGEDATEFREGVCTDCWTTNQNELDDHNARFDWWDGLTDRQRQDQIDGAL